LPSFGLITLRWSKSILLATSTPGKQTSVPHIHRTVSTNLHIPQNNQGLSEQRFETATIWHWCTTYVLNIVLKKSLH
jgi:hypothetical protein